ncbi:MAG: sigma-70 family RNA polymerase sigma factor [Verrucomicrobia bacterium]|nr:sigma-70 family RNA polymerase sigma factor [Verrucomicrobiota bacterium]
MQFDWANFYHAKSGGLILYGRALGLSHCEAEDVLQETFLALMQLPEPPREPEHYCLRCFRNRALNHKRSLWRRLTREWESKRWFEPSADEYPSERLAMRRLAELPPEQRETIVLKIWHGCTFQEIGGSLNVSPHTVAGRFRYGLRKLKSQLAQAIEQEQDERQRNEIIGKTPAWLASTPFVAKA